MRFNRPSGNLDSDIDMTPMIDVVFQLLIFFMVGAGFNVPEKKMPTELPRKGTAAETLPEKKNDLEMVRILITTEMAGIEILCNGRSLGNSFDGLGSMLMELASVDASVPVVIDATPNTAFKFVIRAMDLSKRAKLTRIAFSAGSAQRSTQKPTAE